MTSLLLIPLDDTVVFPTMDVTLPVDVGDEERVLLVPRHEGEYAKVGTIADGRRARPPARRRPRRQLEGVARGVAGAAHTDPPAACASRSTERPDDVARRRPHPRARARVPRRRRGDPRAARRRRARRRVPARDHRARRAGRHLRLLPRPDLRAEGRAARDRSTSPSAWSSALELQRERLTELQVRAQDPRGRRVRRRASSSASTSCASRWSRSGASSARTTPPSSTSTAPRSTRPACPTTCASRPSASSAAWSAWASSPARPR